MLRIVGYSDARIRQVEDNLLTADLNPRAKARVGVYAPCVPSSSAWRSMPVGI